MYCLLSIKFFPKIQKTPNIFIQEYFTYDRWNFDNEQMKWRVIAIKNI